MIQAFEELPRVDVREIVDRTRNKRGFRLTQDFQIVLDTCSIKRIPLTRDEQPLFTYCFENGIPYNFVLTRRVCGELEAQSDKIPWYLRHFVHIISSDIIDPEVPLEDRRIIQEANIRLSLERGKPADLMGYNDMQLVYHALNRARQNLQTLVVSDDTHIARSFHWLREREGKKEIFKKNMFRIGIKSYVQSLYPNLDIRKYPYIVN